MVLWFVGGSWLLVWLVFQDPAVDYRLVMFGALLPDLIDGPFGGSRVLHTLLASVIALGLVMVATRGHRRLRRRLLAMPIGLFVHLILDGMWTDPNVFWWPLRRSSFRGAGPLPSFQHPLAVTIAEEVAGLAAALWCVRRFRLVEPSRAAMFLRSGHLGRDVATR